MADILKFYGLDWMAMSLSLLAVYFLGNKKKSGFVFFILGNTLWLYVGIFLMGSYGIAIGNLVFLFINTRGFFKWKKQKHEQSSFQPTQNKGNGDPKPDRYVPNAAIQQS
ncbi:MAG: nicotinamide mononucleotide transporter [Bacteroidota bacterium]